MSKTMKEIGKEIIKDAIKREMGKRYPEGEVMETTVIKNNTSKLGISINQTGHIYEPVLGLRKPTRVTRVYKGTTRRRFKKDRQQLETQAKRIRSLVIKTPSIPSQLDVGFYLHRRGRTSIKSPCPLSGLNPFKLTRSDGSTTKSFF